MQLSKVDRQFHLAVEKSERPLQCFKQKWPMADLYNPHCSDDSFSLFHLRVNVVVSCALLQLVHAHSMQSIRKFGG